MEPTCTLNDIWITDDGTLVLTRLTNLTYILLEHCLVKPWNSTSGATITMKAGESIHFCINTVVVFNIG